MNQDSALEPAAFLDLWKEKIFLGQEFLSWLWIVSEINGNLLKLKERGEIELWFENRIFLESGEGGDKKTIACQDPSGRWAEALEALRQGKKISRARLKIRLDNKEWGLSLAADSLTPQAVKFPPSFSEGEEEDDSQAGRFLERVALLNELTAIIEALFGDFLRLRLSEAWSEEQLPRLNKWLSGRKDV